MFENTGESLLDPSLLCSEGGTGVSRALAASPSETAVQLLSHSRPYCIAASAQQASSI